MFDLNTMGLIPSEALSPKYLLYWLETKDLALLADGSNVPQINLPDISPLEIPVPSLDDQLRVVGDVEYQMSLIDAMTAAVSRTTGRASRLAHGILERAFNGELVPQDPADEPASVLLERISGVRSSETVGRSRRKLGA